MHTPHCGNLLENVFQYTKSSPISHDLKGSLSLLVHHNHKFLKFFSCLLLHSTSTVDSSGEAALVSRQLFICGVPSSLLASHPACLHGRRIPLWILLSCLSSRLKTDSLAEWKIASRVQIRRRNISVSLFCQETIHFHWLSFLSSLWSEPRTRGHTYWAWISLPLGKSGCGHLCKGRRKEKALLGLLPLMIKRDKIMRKIFVKLVCWGSFFWILMTVCGFLLQLLEWDWWGSIKTELGRNVLWC